MSYRHKAGVGIFQDLDDLGEISQAASETIDLVYDDHIEQDVTKMNLTSTQIALLQSAYETTIAKNSDILKWAEETHFVLSPHLAYRYYASVDWRDEYNEQTLVVFVVL